MKANQENVDSEPTQSEVSDIKANSNSYFAERASVEPEMENKFTLGQLFQSIFGRLHPLFSVDCGALIIYDDSMQHITRAYISEMSSGVPCCLETISDPVSLSLITKEICDFAFPVLKSRENWIDDFGENHCLPNHSSDYNFHCYIPLENNGKVIGTFELHNETKELSSEGLAFCCNIADLLASLLSTLQIPTEQKEVQLSYAEHAAFQQTDHTTDLGNLITELHLISVAEDLHKTVESFILKSVNAVGYAELFLNAEDILFVADLEKSKVQFHSIAAIDRTKIPASYFNLWEKLNINELISVTLGSEAETIGQILLGSTKPVFRQDPLVKIINLAADIITLKIQNIRSLEKIHDQQIEVLNLSEQVSEFMPENIPPENGDRKPRYGMVGTSNTMDQVFRLLDRISSSETTVLILGETGTGKELIAKAIHEASSRRKRPMIKVNCAAIPPNLMESELFGHEKGSFTGATERRIGKFEQAHQSTIFLDEVGELPLNLQVRLLRVLQEKEIERVGGKVTILTDVRIISATNRDLVQEVELGKFRQDLYYRLNVFPISLPPLRERTNDVPVLAMHFLNLFAKKLNRDLQGFSKKAIATLKAHSWPGNVRELEHVIERQVVLSMGPVIKDIDLQSSSNTLVSPTMTSVKTIFENERDHIFSVLELCNGKISGANGAARLLGVPVTTLNSKIKKLGLARKHIF